MDRATKHAEDVVSGKVMSGKLHYLACQRHLNDLQRQNTPEFPYIWDSRKSERILNFAEKLTIAEGTEPKPVKLFDNQCFDLGVPFGWLKAVNGKRRFRRSYECQARQNGKTLKNGVKGVYVAFASGYKYGKLFTAATQKEQAKLAWKDMMMFIQSDDDLNSLFKIQEYNSLITCLSTHCTIQALSKDGGLKDGFRSIYSSLDEIHQMKDNKVYKTIYNGTKALSETLVSMITTRGFDLNSFCYQMDSFCQKILYGTVSAEDFFVDIYTLDEDDDPFNESVWYKANPVLLHPDNPNFQQNLETFRNDATTAKNMSSDLADFMVKSLNLWYRKKSNEFVNPEKFIQCGIDKTLADFSGYTVNIGIDLSSGGDLTSWAIEIPLEENAFFIDSHSYMPRGRFEEHIKTDLAPYDVWEKAGLLTVTGGKSSYKNDYSFIIKELRECIEKYHFKINAIGIDPHNADGILSELETFGVPVTIVTQSARSLNDTTTDIQALVSSKRYFYNKKNELLAYSFMNAETVSNSFDEIKIDKPADMANRRIDPTDAVIDAHYCHIKDKKERQTDVNAELEFYLKMIGGDNNV